MHLGCARAWAWCRCVLINCRGLQWPQILGVQAIAALLLSLLTNVENKTNKKLHNKSRQAYLVLNNRFLFKGLKFKIKASFDYEPNFHTDQLSLDDSFFKKKIDYSVDCKNLGYRVQVWRAEDNFV